ncbi:MAG: ABC transporter ATP-binding protein [Burkholderiaceae bacterium]
MTGKLSVQLSNAAPMPLNVQFDCAPGELIALVGPSGSGKTSVLRAIAGLLKTPSLQGRITVANTVGSTESETVWFDKSVGSKQHTNLSPQDRRVGLVFQNYALFPHLSAIENIALSITSTPASDTNNLPKKLIQRLGLEGLEYRLPSELSGGQQQRVALARALARNPAVLLLDEPFSAVDAPSRTSLYRELANLRNSVSTPMVLVTHDLHEARRLADRVVILDGGKTLQSGTPEQVFSRPRNARVAELVGIQNHFKGRFYKAKDTEQSVWGQLDWQGCMLTVPDKNKLDDGAHVTWVLAAEHLDISPADTTTACEQSLPANTLCCKFLEVLSLGETSICTLAPLGCPDLADVRLTLTLSSAHVRNLGISAENGKSTAKNVSRTVNVHIPPQSVHIMPMRV